MMRFSVVVPVYNGEKYLDECLKSVACQTCDDYELVVVDDGSSDGSGEIADCFAKTHKETLVLHGDNQGLLLARRKGLAHCQGEFVVFLDADDMLRVDALERLSSCIDETGADIVSFRYSRCVDFTTQDDASFLPEGLYERDEYRLFKKAVCAGLSNSLWGKALRLCRIDVDAVYGAYARLMLAEDLVQLLPIVDSARAFARIEDVLYYYRPNEGSSTVNYRYSYIDDTEKAAKRLLGYGSRWGLPEEAISGALRLYVGLSKMLADSVAIQGRAAAEKDLVRLRDSLFGLSPDIKCAVAKQRLDYRLILRAVLAGSLSMLRLVVEVSHLGRKGLGHSI